MLCERQTSQPSTFNLQPQPMINRHNSITAELFAAALLLVTIHPVWAQAAPEPDGPPPGWVGPPPGWSGGVLGGAASVPSYEGSRATRVQPVLGVEMTYRSLTLGSVVMGSRGIAWTVVQNPDLSAGVSLGTDPGRLDNDKKGATQMGYRPGSDALRGMGSISSAPVISAFGSYSLGSVALTSTVRHATSSYNGTGVDFGLLVPWKIGAHAKLSLAPAISWADRRTMQAFFGVTPVQSASSGYAVFDAGAGVKSSQLTLKFEMAFSRAWHINASLQSKWLHGDAANSPITQKATQTGAMLGVLYQFRL